MSDDTRYLVVWDAERAGYGIFDRHQNQWAEQPALGLEHVAQGIAEALNDRERHERRQRTRPVSEAEGGSRDHA